MRLDDGRTYQIRDIHRHVLGYVTIRETTAQWIHGEFRSAPEYMHHQDVFQEFERLVNDQLFGRAQDKQLEISQLEIELATPEGLRVALLEDVQIMNGRDISFRPIGRPELN